VTSILEAFQEAGWFVWVVMAAAFLALTVSVTALGMAMVQRTRQPALTIAFVALVLGLFVPATGGVGYAISMRSVFGAVANVDPSMRATLLAQGISEAMNLIVFGAVCGLVPCALSLVALVRAATRPKS